MSAEWHPLIETTRDEARDLLERALAVAPRLTHFGVGVFDEERKPASQVEQEFREQRAALHDHLDEIAACADWIKLQPTRTAFQSQSSYGRKHDVEKWFEARGGPHMYVSNGSFIAAALGLGIAAKQRPGDGPNMVFKLAGGPLDMAAWERERQR